jgi:hypothetical protein
LLWQRVAWRNFALVINEKEREGAQLARVVDIRRLITESVACMQQCMRHRLEVIARGSSREKDVLDAGHTALIEAGALICL